MRIGPVREFVVVARIADRPRDLAFLVAALRERGSVANVIAAEIAAEPMFQGKQIGLGIVDARYPAAIDDAAPEGRWIGSARRKREWGTPGVNTCSLSSELGLLLRDETLDRLVRWVRRGAPVRVQSLRASRSFRRTRQARRLGLRHGRLRPLRLWVAARCGRCRYGLRGEVPDGGESDDLRPCPLPLLLEMYDHEASDEQKGKQMQRDCPGNG